MHRSNATPVLAALIAGSILLGTAFSVTRSDAPGEPAAAPSSTTIDGIEPDSPRNPESLAVSTTLPDDEEVLDADDASTASEASDAERTVPAGPAPSGSDEGPVLGAPVHEVIPGGGTPPPAGPVDLIGELSDDIPVPEGLDLVAEPPQQGTPAFDGPGGLAVAPSCSHTCISKGVAYPRGFGAELVVATTVPAQLFISAIADLDGDGEYEDTHFETVDSFVQSHSWGLDHLEPGTTYHAMVAATDEDGHTDHAWGTFTTLSQRDVFVSFGDLEIVGGPGGIDGTYWKMGLDGPLQDVTPGKQGILLFKDLPRVIDFDFWILRGWDCDLPEVWAADPAVPQGHDSASCLAWNSTSVDIDLDTKPVGKTRWTTTTVQKTLHTPTGDGGALPPGFGDPYWFSFEVPVTISVTYS